MLKTLLSFIGALFTTNNFRPRLERRSKKKNAVEARLDLLTEQIKEIKDNKGDDEDESVEDDIIDEYGNIIPQQLQVIISF